jgi:hypothetical protein
MQISYYKKPILVFLITFLVGILIFILFPPNSTPYTILIPIDDATIEILMLLIIYPISGLLGSFLIGYILVPIILSIHVKIWGRKLEYGFIETNKPEKFKKTFNGFFPILLAVNLALILASNQDLMKLIIYPDHQVTEGVNSIGVIFLLMYTVGISMGIFSAIWMINDAGVVYSNKKKVERTDKPFEIRSVGNFIKSLLKGYAGLSVIVSFINYIFFYMITFGNYEELIVNTFIQILIPIALACFNAISIMFLDISKETNIKYVRYFGKKLGIVDELEISINKR